MHQSSCQRVGDTPTENEVNGWQIIRKFYEGKTFSLGTIDILLSSWREDNITYACLNGVHIAGKETLIHFYRLNIVFDWNWI